MLPRLLDIVLLISIPWLSKPTPEPGAIDLFRQVGAKIDTAAISFVPEELARKLTTDKHREERTWLTKHLSGRYGQEVTVVMVVVINGVTSTAAVVLDNQCEFAAEHGGRSHIAIGLVDNRLVVPPGKTDYTYAVFLGRIDFSKKDKFCLWSKPRPPYILDNQPGCCTKGVQW